MTPARPAVSTSWREGQYFDLWMVVHFATGVAGGFSNVFFELSTLKVYIIATVLMVLWEVFEYVMGVREAMVNRIGDVFVGLAGMQMALWIASTLSPRGKLIAFFAGLAFSAGSSALGWIAFKRRATKLAKNAKKAKTARAAKRAKA